MDLQFLDQCDYDNITIKPFPEDIDDIRTKGVFVYYIKGQADSGNEFFDKALKSLWKFLNYLTLRRNHGFMEYHFWFTHNPIPDKDLFLHTTLPLGLTERIHQQGAFWHDISYDVQESLKDVHQEKLIPELQDKIDNALFYFRSSFFQQTEQMCLVQQFIALEALSEESRIIIDPQLLREIQQAVKDICQNRPLSSKATQRTRDHKILSQVGRLSEEGPTSKMRNTLQKYRVDFKWNNKKGNIGELYGVRSEIIHTGKPRSIPEKDCHKLCMKMEEIIPRLVKEIINKNTQKSCST